MATSNYSKKETVVGWLEPADGLIRVYARNNLGKIKRILVEDGQWVTKGTPLVIINGDSILEDGTVLEDSLLLELNNQQSLVNEQIRRTAAIYKTRQANLEKQISASKSELLRLKEQLETLHSRLKILETRTSKYTALFSKGDISQLQLDNSIEKLLQLQYEILSLDRNKISKQDLLEQLHVKLELLKPEKKNEIDSLNRVLSELSQKTAQLNGQRAYTIKAPKQGYVTSLNGRVGQQLSSTVPIMSIIPESAQMIAKVLVPVTAVGFVEENQFLDIRYDAFPYQKFGIYTGKINHVATSISLPNELNNIPIQISEPAYLVSAILKDPKVSAYGKDINLKPGMTLSADIRLKDRTLLEWLFEPLLSLRGRI
ncbi:toxin secretion, membrane fusion protein [Tenacibaculum sp. KUL152]|nr:toxin secretion, membrane fusion protein [Tenacibaculum sp. KUL152]